MKQIINLLLVFVLGNISGYYIGKRFFIPQLMQTIEPLPELVIRKMYSVRKAVAMIHFSKRTKLVCLVCPQCGNNFIMRLFCKR